MKCFRREKKKGPIACSAMPKSTAGFTLVELLVSIAIISIIIGIVVVGVDSVRVKSRDTKRISDLGLLRSAIEEYFDDFGEYPQCSPSQDACASWKVCGSFVFLSTLNISAYIRAVPEDPINGIAGENKYAYYYRRGFRKTGEYSTPRCVSINGSLTSTEFLDGQIGNCLVGNPNKEYILATQLEGLSLGSPFMCGGPNYFIGSE